MKVKELIAKLQKIEDQDLPVVCMSDYSEYFGAIYDYVDEVEVQDYAQPDGPKKSAVKSVVLS